MILNLNHKKMDVWIKSKNLVKEIYIMCEKIPSSEKYTLVPQIKRSAISVLSNISEGYARKSEKELKRFLDISRSSLVELDTQIELAIELELVTEIDLKIITQLVIDIFAMLTKLINKNISD